MEAVLDLFLGDVAAFMARGLVTRKRATDWIGDLRDVLVLEAVERFQIKITLPDNERIAFDYEVSDDGQVGASDACGGFASHWIPANAEISLVVRWRRHAPHYEKARKLLRDRGWGAATMLEASTAPERAYSKDGYGLYRRTVGDWQV